MNYFWERNKIVFAIILGAVIIGGCVYFGLKNKKAEIATSPSAPRNDAEKADVGRLPVLITSSSSLKSTEDGPPPASLCGAGSDVIVTKVIDGDTVVVEGGYHVRLLGVDADEKNHPCYEMAKDRLEELVLGKQVTLEKDKTDIDQYGRCLRYIFVEDKNISVQLAKDGMAVARFYNPDIKYKTEITEAEKLAQTSKIGCKWLSK